MRCRQAVPFGGHQRSGVRRGVKPSERLSLPVGAGGCRAKVPLGLLAVGGADPRGVEAVSTSPPCTGMLPPKAGQKYQVAAPEQQAALQRERRSPRPHPAQGYHGRPRKQAESRELVVLGARREIAVRHDQGVLVGCGQVGQLAESGDGSTPHRGLGVAPVPLTRAAEPAGETHRVHREGRLASLRSSRSFIAECNARAAAKQGAAALLPVKQRLQQETGPCRQGAEISGRSPGTASGTPAGGKGRRP